MPKTLAKTTSLHSENKVQSNGFSERLRMAMQQKGKRPSPILLEREFNLRWRGTPVTANSVRKWLWGLSIPTLDKQRVLAKWLDVSEDWLRWGEKNPSAHSSVNGSPPSEEQSFLQDYRLLAANNQRLIRGMMELLLREQNNTSAIEATAIN